MPKALLTALALFALGSVAAQSAVQAAELNVAAQNELTVISGSEVYFETVGAGDNSTATSSLAFSTNDGQTYSILVEPAASGWSFTAEVDGASAESYPVLRVESAIATAGEALAAPAKLIDSWNGTFPVEVVGGVRSAAGEVYVKFELESGEEVVAGRYHTRVSYTLSAP